MRTIRDNADSKLTTGLTPSRFKSLLFPRKGTHSTAAAIVAFSKKLQRVADVHTVPYRTTPSNIRLERDFDNVEVFAINTFFNFKSSTICSPLPVCNCMNE
jgi:hypothetical protein